MPGAGELGLRIRSSLFLGGLAILMAWLGGVWFQLFWLAAAGLIFGELASIAAFRPLWVVLGAVYTSAFLAAMVLLRNGEYGLTAILWLFALIWAADTAAYFAGRAIGGPKLWPAVSPNKTWSGAIAGMIAGIAAGVGVIWASGLAVHPKHVEVAFIVVAAAQAGDLLESAFKRYFAVKDSGRLIPGHGGVMDRCDSLVLASVVALLLGLYRAVDAPAQGLLLW